MNDPLANWQPRGVDLSVPSSARMYDYYLGGKDNFAIDREAAERVIAEHPQQKRLALNNRAFLSRAVRAIAEAGVKQFIDVGTGIPTSPSVHEIARDVHPDSRVVYVDSDPVVLAHNRALLVEDDAIVTIDADMRDPDGVLANSELRRLIDFDQPVGVLFVSVFHFLPGDEPQQIVGRFRDVMAPGSYVATSIGSREGLSEEDIARMSAGYENTAVSTIGRSRAEIEDILAGFELVEPGLTDVSQWRADAPRTQITILAGVGRKP